MFFVFCFRRRASKAQQQKLKSFPHKMLYFRQIDFFVFALYAHYRKRYNSTENDTTLFRVLPHAALRSSHLVKNERTCLVLFLLALFGRLHVVWGEKRNNQKH